jgi:hypothetical protein
VKLPFTFSKDVKDPRYLFRVFLFITKFKQETKMKKQETELVTLEQVLANCFSVYDIDMFCEQASDILDRDCFGEPFQTIFVTLEEGKEIIERMTLLSKYYTLLDTIECRENSVQPMFATIKEKLYLACNYEIFEESSSGWVDKLILEAKIDICTKYGFDYAYKDDANNYMLSVEFLNIMIEMLTEFKND